MSKAYVIKIYFEQNEFNVKISKAFMTNNLKRDKIPNSKKKEKHFLTVIQILLLFSM